MPSTTSSSVAMVWLSSTVMTPSFPTLSIASAMRSPICGSWDEIAATWATSSWPLTGTERFLISSTTAWTAFSIPILSCIGLAPAVTLRKPSLIMVCARIVAVVVPSPATSFVFVAGLELHRHLGAVVQDPSSPHCLDDALLGLLFGGVRKDDPALGLLFPFNRLDHNPVAQRSQFHVRPSSAVV